MRAADNQVEDRVSTDCSTCPLERQMLCDLTGKDVVDRLPVVVSGAEVMGVPKLTSGTIDGPATAVAKVLQDWGIVNHVCTMCFDTTSTNTGHRNGSCVLLEQKLEKDLLYLACRHHILEWLVFSRKSQL